MNSSRPFGRIAASLLIGGVILLSGTVSKGQSSSEFNRPGNILITDQFNNRVIEIDPAGNIVWQFGNGPGDTSANAIVGTNDAERVGNFTLMSGTGIPAGATTNCKRSGCVDNRVILVDSNGDIVWQYGEFGVTGFGPNQLNNPNAAELLWFLLPERNPKRLGTSFGAVVIVYTGLVLNSG